jgi:hypothetical protein
MDAFRRIYRLDQYRDAKRWMHSVASTGWTSTGMQRAAAMRRNVRLWAAFILLRLAAR